MCLCPPGGPDGHQMALLRVAGPYVIAHRVPSDGGGPHPMQLQPLSSSRRVECVATPPDPRPPRALALLVGRRPQLRRAHPSRALQ